MPTPKKEDIRIEFSVENWLRSALRPPIEPHPSFAPLSVDNKRRRPCQRMW